VEKRIGNWITPGHTRALFEPKRLNVVVEYLVDQIKRLGGIEAIACCGFSGIIPASIVANRLGIDIIAIRKQSEESRANGDGDRCNTHPGRPVYKRWVIVDDLISSGRTMRWIIRQVKDHNITTRTMPTAIILHAEDERTRWSWGRDWDDEEPISGVSRSVRVEAEDIRQWRIEEVCECDDRPDCGCT